MVKRFIALGLAAVMLLLCGCSAVFKKEYLSVSEYTDEEHNEFHRDAADIATYDELKAAINSMIYNHIEVERLLFTDYEGESLQNDLAQACGEVKEDTALGSYCVEYISYDPQRIITYFEATITINYKRTQAEVEAITYATGYSHMLNILDEAMSSLSSYTAIRINDSDLTEADIISAVNTAFGRDPLSCVFLPDTTVTVHPAAGFNRIVEINFNYGKSRTALGNMKDELQLAASNMTAGMSMEQPATFLLQAYNALSAFCKYDPSGSLREGMGDLDPAYNSTVYGALSDGIADSTGMALAYSALCGQAGIDCIVVNGTFNKAEHSWNIVKLGSEYYHVDVSADRILGVTGAFLRSDEQMRGNYWWNIEDYPECATPINTAEIFS